MPIAWEEYPATSTFDELIVPGGGARDAARSLVEYLSTLGVGELMTRQRAAEAAIRGMGITFTVYHQEGGSIDRSWPLDIIPRVIALQEWQRIEAGLQQRARALNLFINDIYHAQQIVHAGVFPREFLADSANFRPQCVGINPPLGVWAHVCGSDLIRGADGTVFVLEDNLRVPSGVSYMLENREVMMRLFPELFARHRVAPVETYTDSLLATLRSVAPEGSSKDPTAVVLTPGPYNSAFYEHSFLADKMGVELVEGSDLFVQDARVFMRTTEGLRRVDVIYRRVDDDFIDPLSFRRDSSLGVAGLFNAYRSGSVVICNAPGTGVADDKAVYAYVPAIIRYYLAEDAILPGAAQVGLGGGEHAQQRRGDHGSSRGHRDP